MQSLEAARALHQCRGGGPWVSPLRRRRRRGPRIPACCVAGQPKPAVAGQPKDPCLLRPRPAQAKPSQASPSRRRPAQAVPGQPKPRARDARVLPARARTSAPGPCRQDAASGPPVWEAQPVEWHDAWVCLAARHRRCCAGSGRLGLQVEGQGLSYRG